MQVRQGTGIILAVMALAGGASAQEIVDPTWASIPDGQAMTDAYPEFASMVALDGEVNLRCRVAPDGTLSLCQVNSASPTGLGFDRAALSLIPRFRANPRQVDGEITKSSVQFTIRFRMATPKTPAPWTGREPSPEHRAAVAILIKDMQTSPEFDPDLETLDLQVDPGMEDRVRAMVLQVDGDAQGEKERAATLALARLLSPEQLADIQAGGPWPERPSEAALASAGDVANEVSERMIARLRELYCAEFECPQQTAASAP